ncbi:MAG: hypothetical protein ACI8QZ_000060 [Chlamydiales bacterium]|jgi:uncharacterized protein YhaN
MRITSIEVESFGTFEQQSWALNDAVEVVLGQNEAGKSTWLAAIETLLYGFEPATRERHPLTRWSAGGKPLTVRGKFQLPGGEQIHVERQLASRAMLRIAQEGAAFSGARKSNRPLREADGTSRSLFRSVYALTSTQLVELSDDVRQAVDEMLLGESALPGLLPMHRVRAELAEARQRLWRPDNRGKPLARGLRAELNEARKAFHGARKAEEGLRAGILEHESLRTELEELSARRVALEREREDAVFLRDVADLRRRRDALNALDLRGLAGEPLLDPQELESEAHELAQTMLEHETRVASRVVLTSTHARILEHAGAIEAARTAHARYEARQEALEDARDRMRRVEGEALAAWTRLAGGRPQRAHLQRVRMFAIEGLRAELSAWESNREARSKHEWATVWGWLCAFVGTAVVVATSLDWLAPAFVALGLTFLFLSYLELRMRGLSREVEHTPEPVRSTLAMLGLGERLGSTPLALARLIDQLEAVVTRLDELEAAENRTLGLARELEVQEEDWEGLLVQLQLGASADGIEALAQLEDALARARERAQRVRADRAERERAQTFIDACRPRLERVRGRLERITAVLRKNVLGQPDRCAAYRTLDQRIQDAQYLDGRLQELRLDARWEHLVEGQPMIDPDSLGEHAEGVRARKLSALDERAATIHGRIGQLTEQQRECPANRVANAKEQVVELEARVKTVEREHDRLALAEAILGHADRRWRAENQPDVLRRASAYLRKISAGRYTRLDYPAGGDAGLFVHDASNEALPAAPPLSRGTRDQIYLALRLGLLDHLDEGRSALPLILDEALVHWDADRRKALYPLLTEVSRRRQVIVLTCHDVLAAEAATALGTSVRTLDAPPIPTPPLV